MNKYNIYIYMYNYIYIMIKYDLCIYISVYVCMYIYIYTSKYQNIPFIPFIHRFSHEGPRAQRASDNDRPSSTAAAARSTVAPVDSRDFWWFAMGFMGICHEKWWIDHEKWWFTVNDDDLKWDLCGCTQDLVGFIMDFYNYRGVAMDSWGFNDDLDGFIVIW